MCDRVFLLSRKKEKGSLESDFLEKIILNISTERTIIVHTNPHTSTHIKNKLDFLIPLKKEKGILHYLCFRSTILWTKLSTNNTIPSSNTNCPWQSRGSIRYNGLSHKYHSPINKLPGNIRLHTFAFPCNLEDPEALERNFRTASYIPLNNYNIRAQRFSDVMEE